MADIVSRVPTLSFIDVADVLVFARAGRSNAEGAFATCHCLSLPPSEPGYYFWRDRTTHKLTRRSEWFVTKSPTVTIGGRDIKYMISFALPRFCDQSLDKSRKERFYPGAANVDVEARYGRTRALSHRSGTCRHPPHRKRGRDVFGELPRSPLLRAGVRDGACVYGRPAGRRRAPSSPCGVEATIHRPSTSTRPTASAAANEPTASDGRVRTTVAARASPPRSSSRSAASRSWRRRRAVKSSVIPGLPSVGAPCGGEPSAARG